MDVLKEVALREAWNKSMLATLRHCSSHARAQIEQQVRYNRDFIASALGTK